MDGGEGLQPPRKYGSVYWTGICWSCGETLLQTTHREAKEPVLTGEQLEWSQNMTHTPPPRNSGQGFLCPPGVPLTHPQSTQQPQGDGEVMVGSRDGTWILPRGLHLPREVTNTAPG